MRRIWSIRTRTALVFAIAAMALATGVVVFTNLMSISGAGQAVATVGADPTVPDDMTGWSVSAALPSRATPDPTSAIGEGDLAVVELVAAQQWHWSAVGVGAAGVLAGGVGYVVSRRMLRPIDRITTTADRISASNLHERIALTGPDDELRRLSRTVDDLLDRLQTSFESQRRFVAQASHELRTPLAVQRAALQIGLPDDADRSDVRSAREELLEQNRRTERILESLLLLAEADRGLGDARATIDVGEVCADVVASVQGVAGAADVTVTHESTMRGRALVRGDETLTQQLVLNLVSNAIEYNEPGGFVRVTTSADGLVVENSGPAVPQDLVPLLVEPFRRCPRPTESGRHSGLGLSIVASIAQAHGWSLTLDGRTDGGLRVRVSLV